MICICVSKLTIVGSDKRLLAWTSPSHYLNQCWDIVNWTRRNKLQRNINKFHTFSSMKMHMKMLFGKWRPFCLGLNELTCLQLMTWRQKGSGSMVLTKFVRFCQVCVKSMRNKLWIICKGFFENINQRKNIYIRADLRIVPSQWETSSLCNNVSHWLSASLESALYMMMTSWLLDQYFK